MAALSTLLAPLFRRAPALDLAERKRRLERTLCAQGVSRARAKYTVGRMMRSR